MEEVLALIDKIIEEHKQIIGRFQSLEQVANDAQAIVGLEKAKEAFMPGRFEMRQGLQKLQELLEITDRGIKAHFDREETGLLAAFEKHGGRMLASALRALLPEHENFKDRLAHSKKHLADLTGGELSRQVWEASAYDIRAYLTHTQKLFEAHAQSEQKLFQTLRNQLKRE